MINAGVSIAAMMRQMMYIFWDSAEGVFSFIKKGMHIMCRGVKRHLQLDFAGFLADDLAQCSIASVKNSSGTKLCMDCGNVISRVDPARVQPGLAHFTEPDSSKWTRNTPRVLEQCADALETLKNDPTVSKERFAKAEQAVGIVYNKSSILFDKYMRKVANIPDSIIWDSQHNLWASGGVGQYHLNQLCRKIKALHADRSLLDLDKFAASMTFPRGVPRLPPRFFRDRVVNKPGKRIKGVCL